MNTIKNYLDNMFRNLPNTEEVRRAKAELLQMMEDKYEELIGEGKSENEAVGIVISEFGNLDELAESLGISEAVTENPDEAKPMLSMDRVKDYLAMMSKHSIYVPLGIALCIFSVAFNILADIIPGLNLEALGVSSMFLAIGGAVVLFVLSGIKKKEFAEVKRKECSLSIEGAEYVRAERKSFKSSYGLMSSFGIGLCILSIINPIIFGSIPYIDNDFGAIMFFLFIAAGVFLITSSNIRMNGYDRILELNETGKMSEEFVPKSDRKVNKLPIIICAVVAVSIAVMVGGISVASSIYKGISNIAGITISGDEFVETMETNYELTGDSKMNGELNSVKLDLKACSVKFVVEEGSGLIDVNYTGDKKLKPEITFENGKLVATQKGSSSFRVNGFNAPRLTITIGTDVDLSNLEMKIKAGDIDMDDIKGDYLFGDFDAGNINIDNCTFRKADLDADAGNIEIDNSDIRILKINTDAGNIEISGTSFDDIEVNSDFGNVEIHDVDDIDSYSIECKVDAGIVQVGHNSLGRKYNTQGSGSGSIKVSVDAGNIEID
ncbi:MAG: DUF4097 domain-containing protein [Saccharofermentans sp.]|nr:DUF4097 domain-containing protein [Saccharofermentans sp.]